MKNIRWGDIGLIGIEKLTKDLIEIQTNIIAKGNNGHDHTFTGGKIYITKDEKNLQEEDFIFGYLEAKDTILYHEDHGIDVGNKLREVKIEDGFYELVKQKEYGAEGLRPVID